MKIIALFKNEEWPKYYKSLGTRHRDTKFGNVIVTAFRKGMGLSGKDEDNVHFLPLPWSYFDMTVLSITEFAHNRIIGMIGVIIGVMEDLIPYWHKKDWSIFCASKPASTWIFKLQQSPPCAAVSRRSTGVAASAGRFAASKTWRATTRPRPSRRSLV